ncbi:uncharacterized protein LOC120785466 isoform X2 [Xiphias gladius]|uniref:uncharacterized protein LOC120785466 isoform X2 n=1 Tax=Xiphias gladius TaxID=8245 RepID=UPI001A98B6DE|nr:uncharacterized protein LOC120785466 isoform X2 [Xiphias gladius]
MSTEEETEEKLLEGSNSANKNLIALSAKVGAAQKSQVSQSDAKVFRRSLSSKLKIWMAPPKERRVFAQDSDGTDSQFLNPKAFHLRPWSSAEEAAEWGNWASTSLLVKNCASRHFKQNLLERCKEPSLHFHHNSKKETVVVHFHI